MTDDANLVKSADELEKVLKDLLQVEEFEPPTQFRERARIRDSAVYAEAERDPEGWWAERARELHWHRPFTTVLDDSNPPFYKWFPDGELNVSYNCVDRHVEAGNGDRVAYHWRGEEGEEASITYADLHRDVQRLANGLKDLGVTKGDTVGIFLPMIPEVVVAMLACARIGAPAQRRLRRLLPRVGARAHGGLTCEGADHRQRRPTQGQDGAHQARGRRGHVRPAEPGAHRCGAGHRDRVRHAGRAGRLVRRAARPQRTGLPRRPNAGRASAVHPLLLRLDGEAEGHRAHHRRIPHGGGRHPTRTSSTSTRSPTSSGVPPTSGG